MRKMVLIAALVIIIILIGMIAFFALGFTAVLFSSEPIPESQKAYLGEWLSEYHEWGSESLIIMSNGRGSYAGKSISITNAPVKIYTDRITLGEDIPFLSKTFRIATPIKETNECLSAVEAFGCKVIDLDGTKFYQSNPCTGTKEVALPDLVESYYGRWGSEDAQEIVIGKERSQYYGYSGPIAISTNSATATVDIENDKVVVSAALLILFEKKDFQKEFTITKKPYYIEDCGFYPDGTPITKIMELDGIKFYYSGYQGESGIMGLN